MNFMVLIMVITLLIFIGVICLCESNLKWGWGFVIMAIPPSLWLAYASLQPLQVSKTFTVFPIKVQKEDGVYNQVLVYVDQDGKEVIENVNKLFNGTIPESSKIEVTEYKTYYYCGLSYKGFRDVCDTTYRLAKAN